LAQILINVVGYMTMLDLKNIWPKYSAQNITYTQLAHIGNKYNYEMWKNKPIKTRCCPHGT